jgi:hypothetical protein
VLTPNKHEVQPLDLYLNISQNITISVHGKSDVHLSGYFEPNNSLEDQMYGNGMEEEDDEEEGEDDLSDDDAIMNEHMKNLQKVTKGEHKNIVKVHESRKEDLDKSLKAANKNTMKNSL